MMTVRYRCDLCGSIGDADKGLPPGWERVHVEVDVDDYEGGIIRLDLCQGHGSDTLRHFQQVAREFLRAQLSGR